MGMILHRSAALALCLALSTPAAALQLDDEAMRAARWGEVRQAIFGAKPVAATTTAIALDAPVRALDAALVPITLTLHDPDIVAVHLVIDENPSPYAAHIVFGPAADRSAVTLRVRINGYTNVHAIAEMRDGRLLATTRFVKAAGGCSAPVGGSDAEALAGIGDMRMTFDTVRPGKPVVAMVMVRHPNFSGMQMNQVTRLYTPPRYIQRLEVSAGDRSVFALDGDIALSSNPAVGFAFDGAPGQVVKVVAVDSDRTRWEHSFTVPAAGQ